MHEKKNRLTMIDRSIQTAFGSKHDTFVFTMIDEKYTIQIKNNKGKLKKKIELSSHSGLKVLVKGR